MWGCFCVEKGVLIGMMGGVGAIGVIGSLEFKVSPISPISPNIPNSPNNSLPQPSLAPPYHRQCSLHNRIRSTTGLEQALKV